ncbi:MAG: hypothetical protein WBG46_14455 [Nonlabens sp.]
MTPTQEMVSVLFEKDTLEKAKAQFKSRAEKTPIDGRDMSFRLFKTKYGNINLEMLCRDSKGMYFKPIGYYEFEKGGLLSSGNLTVTVLNEFKDDYNSVGEINPTNTEVKFMNIRQSGIIAAFSKETFNAAQEMYAEKENSSYQSYTTLLSNYRPNNDAQYDKRIQSNGLIVELFFCEKGYPQSFLDDKYGLDGPIGAYHRENGQFSVSPMVKHLDIYEEFMEMGLLTVFNGF